MTMAQSKPSKYTMMEALCCIDLEIWLLALQCAEQITVIDLIRITDFIIIKNHNQ